MLSKDNILIIQSYQKEERKGTPEEFKSLASVDDVSVQYGITYQKSKVVGGEVNSVQPSQMLPPKLSFTLVFDKTQVLAKSYLAAKLNTNETVAEQVNKFLDICYKYDGSTHTSRFLKIKWADIKAYSCKLQSCNVQYGLINPKGIPLRAIVTATFIYDVPKTKADHESSKTSPDVTHRKQFKAGDSLPMLAKEMYGSSSYYLLLAQYNGFDHFRNIPAGTEIKLPSIQELNKTKLS